jgi:hypothetical protein
MQEVIGSTPIFSTKVNNKPDSQPIGIESGFSFDKTLPASLYCNQLDLDMTAPSCIIR